MRAAWFESFGPARDVLEVGRQPDPVPAAGEVLVRLSTSGVNPSDVKKRAGSFPDLLNDGLVIPHSDGAGTIEGAGEGVDPARVGERVWLYQAQYARRFGTAAELIAIDAARAVPLPAGTSETIGACLGIPAMTAHRCVFADGDVDRQTVLVTGGAGRVGHYAIQWAAGSGARVIATASNDADAASCRAAGAVTIVNHREAGWGKAVLEANGGEPVDRVVDVEFGANLEEVMQCIRVSGVIATYSSTVVPEPRLPFFQMMYRDLTVRTVIVYAMPESAKQAAIAAINEALEAGALQHRIAAQVPLEKIADAHEMIEGGEVRGCVVVTLA